MKIVKLDESIENLNRVEDVTPVEDIVMADARQSSNKVSKESVIERVKEILGTDAFLGATKQPVPKKVTTPKPLLLDESLDEDCDNELDEAVLDEMSNTSAWSKAGNKAYQWIERFLIIYFACIDTPYPMFALPYTNDGNRDLFHKLLGDDYNIFAAVEKAIGWPQRVNTPGKEKKPIQITTRINTTDFMHTTDNNVSLDFYRDLLDKGTPEQKSALNTLGITPKVFTTGGIARQDDKNNNNGTTTKATNGGVSFASIKITDPSKFKGFMGKAYVCDNTNFQVEKNYLEDNCKIIQVNGKWVTTADIKNATHRFVNEYFKNINSPNLEEKLACFYLPCLKQNEGKSAVDIAGGDVQAQPAGADSGATHANTTGAGSGAPNGAAQNILDFSKYSLDSEDDEEVLQPFDDDEVINDSLSQCLESKREEWRNSLYLSRPTKPTSEMIYRKSLDEDKVNRMKAIYRKDIGLDESTEITPEMYNFDTAERLCAVNGWAPGQFKYYVFDRID